MALFGPGIEETFLLLQTARREIEVSAAMLLQDPEPKSKTEHNLEFWNSMRADVWPAYGKLAKKGDQVGKKLLDFTPRMERLCRPIVDRGYGTTRSTMSGSLADWFFLLHRRRSKDAGDRAPFERVGPLDQRQEVAPAESIAMNLTHVARD